MSRDTYPEQRDPSELLPIGEAARLLGVSVGTVRRWESEGRISSARTLGGQRRFRLGDVERLSGSPA